MNEEDYNKAKKHAAGRLARQSQSSTKLKQALQRKELNPEAIDKVIEEFTEHGYIDDKAYAVRLIQKEMANLRGPVWIIHKLRQQGYTRELAEELVEEHYPEDLQEEKAQALLAKKKPADRRKEFALLYQNGFRS